MATLRHAAAATLASAAATIRQKIRVPIGAVERDSIEHVLSEARRLLSPGEYDRAWAEGQGLTVDDLTKLVRA